MSIFDPSIFDHINSELDNYIRIQFNQDDGSDDLKHFFLNILRIHKLCPGIFQAPQSSSSAQISSVATSQGNHNNRNGVRKSQAKIGPEELQVVEINIYFSFF